MENICNQSKAISLDKTQGESLVRIWSVSTLLRAISSTLEARFNPVLVQGELSGFSRASSGHCYFSLKDSDGQLRCVLFRRAASLLDFSPTDGLKVEIRGNLGLYEPKGDLQFIAESMRLAGDGNLYEQFLRLKKVLENEGLFTTERKRALLSMPRAIGLVTSLAGAALHDVATTFKRLSPHIPVVIYPASVQGTRAVAELCNALSLAFEHFVEHQLDVLLIVRGGGSVEDLSAFNNENLVRMIAASPIPVITGIGHETDFTLADFCADKRAATPTAAAQQSTQSLADLQSVLNSTGVKIQKTIELQVQNHSQRIDWTTSRIGQPSFVLEKNQGLLTQREQAMGRFAEKQIQHQKFQLENKKAKFYRASLSFLRTFKSRIEQAQMRMTPLNPDLILQRGFVWVMDAKTSQPVTHARKIKQSQVLKLQFSDGSVEVKSRSLKQSID